MSGKQNFFYKLTLFGVATLAVALVLYATVLKAFYFQLFPLVFLLIFIVTAFSYHRLIKVSEKNMLRFTSAYMQMTLLKFVLYIAFLLICLLTKSVAGVAGFVITFFVLYLIFSVFEVVQLLAYYNEKRS